MAAKKRSRKKIDLRDLPSLGIGVSPSTDATPELETIQPEQATEATPELETIQPEQATEATPELETIQPKQATEATLELETIQPEQSNTLDTTQQEQPNSPVQEQDTTIESLPSESVSEALSDEEAPKQEEHYLERTPQRPQLKILQTLGSAINASGEVFNPGDKIWAKAPWGKRAIAEIIDFYQDKEGNAWARYTSDESYPGWTWSGGCIRAQGLTKAETE